MSAHFRLFQWFLRRRESKRLALIAKAAQLVIQQNGATWSNKKCPNCGQSVSDIANFCAMCGHSFVPELQPEKKQPGQEYRPCEIERHTSGIRPIVNPQHIEAARVRAKALEPSQTFTARLKAVKLPQETPLQAYLRAMKGK